MPTKWDKIEIHTERVRDDSPEVIESTRSPISSVLESIGRAIKLDVLRAKADNRAANFISNKKFTEKSLRAFYLQNESMSIETLQQELLDAELNGVEIRWLTDEEQEKLGEEIIDFLEKNS